MRGQAAMEYLVSYGWAVLVVLVAIGALAYFGVIDTGRWAPSSFSMSDGFSAAEFKIDQGGATFFIYNTMGYDVTILSYTVTSDACNDERNVDSQLANGEKFVIDGVACPDVAVGQRIKGALEIVYQRAGETVTHTARGEFSTAVEESGFSCGDGNCDGGENCRTCPDDCACGEGLGGEMLRCCPDGVCRERCSPRV